MIVEAIYQQINNKLIESQFNIIQKDGSLVVKTNLTSKLITKSKVIYLEEILHYKYSFNQFINQLESTV
jgi:hypothetical protein